MLIKSDKYDKIVNNIVYVAFFIHQYAFVFAASKIIRDTWYMHDFANYMKIISFFVMSLTIFYYFLRGKFSVKEIIIYIAIAIPLLISLWNYRVVMVIANLFYAAIFKNVDSGKSIKVALYATILGFVINIIIGFITGYTGDCEQVRYGILRIRHGLGFYYAYMTSYFYLTIVLIYILAFDSINFIQYFILSVFGIIIFILTDTKAAFVYTIFALILHYVLVKKDIKFFGDLFDKFTIAAYPIASVLAIILPVFYNENNVVWAKLNSMVNNRLIYGQRSISACGWKLFGQTCIVDVPGVRNIDSSFLSMLVLNGLIPLLMSVVFMTFYSYMAVKTRNKKLMLVLDVIAIRAVFDLGFMSMQLAPVIILFYDVLNKFIENEVYVKKI